MPPPGTPTAQQRAASSSTNRPTNGGYSSSGYAQQVADYVRNNPVGAAYSYSRDPNLMYTGGSATMPSNPSYAPRSGGSSGGGGGGGGGGAAGMSAAQQQALINLARNPAYMQFNPYN